MFDNSYDPHYGNTAVITFSGINVYDDVSIASNDFAIHGNGIQVYSHTADAFGEGEVTFTQEDGATIASFIGTHAHELTLNFDKGLASITFNIPPLLELLGCGGELLPANEGSGYAGLVVLDSRYEPSDAVVVDTEGATIPVQNEATSGAATENASETPVLLGSAPEETAENAGAVSEPSDVAPGKMVERNSQNTAGPEADLLSATASVFGWI
ncbi:hypothetical protein [Anaplasma capra]|uniref:hypothetical protein n=1 Tax=Anaplasma capra TaxID=1562740 RepID=UPI0021D5DCAC|nr:hypothetical protein [Anaplasma capra]MCU7611239.1 hypothetical protein [Anaplasma capra]MCU7612611.1 hypothetical protein [Anaplasma capra]